MPADFSAQVITQLAVSKMFLVLQATAKHGKAKAHHSLSETSSESCSSQARPLGLVVLQNWPENWLQSQICQQMGGKTSAG